MNQCVHGKYNTGILYKGTNKRKQAGAELSQAEDSVSFLSFYELNLGLKIDSKAVIGPALKQVDWW